MSALHVPALAPDILAVLRDVARQPDSALLRVRARDLAPASLARIEAVRPSAWWLTKAERQLVQVHREELAFLVRCRVVAGLHGAERPGAANLEFARGARLDLAEIRHGADRLGACLESAADAVSRSEHAELAACIPGTGVPGPRGRDPGVPGSVAIALRLRDHAPTQFNYGAYLQETGRPSSARAVYAQLLAGGADGIAERLALEGLGALAACAGDFAAAADWYGRAAERPSAGANACFFSALNSLQCGDADRAWSQAERLADLPGDSRQWVSDFQRALGSARERSGWAPTEAARRLLARTPARAGLLAEVVHGF